MTLDITNGSSNFSTVSLGGCPEHDLASNASDTLRRFYFALSVMSVVLAIATILPNSLFLAAMISYRRKITTGQKMLMALSGVDLMQGLAMWPLKIAFHHLQSRGTIDCVLSYAAISVAFSLNLATITAIFLITLEQYMAITFPLYHRTSVTFSRLVPALPLCTSLNVIICVVLYLRLNEQQYWRIYKASLGIWVLIFATLIIVLQGHVAYIAQCRSRKIREKNLAEGMAIKTKARAMKISLTIVLTFLLAYSPYTGYYGYMTISKNNSPLLRTYVLSVVHLMALCNPVVNPLVYYWRSHFVRKAVKRIVMKSLSPLTKSI